MDDYAAWRISYQSSEQAARAAFNELLIVKHLLTEARYTLAARDRELAEARRDGERYRQAGSLLSNIAFNLAQDTKLEELTRYSLDDARKRWDATIEHSQQEK